MREDKAKGEVERLGRECQELRWRWGEDVAAWRRREGEASIGYFPYTSIREFRSEKLTSVVISFSFRTTYKY
jgi:hypothetical protein